MGKMTRNWLKMVPERNRDHELVDITWVTGERSTLGIKVTLAADHQGIYHDLYLDREEIFRIAKPLLEEMGYAEMAKWLFAITVQLQIRADSAKGRKANAVN